MSSIENERIVCRSFDAPDQSAELSNVKSEVVHFGAFTIIRITFFPGMIYSRDVRPYISPEQERAPRRAVYCQSGRLHFVQPDGSSVEMQRDGVYLVPPWENGFQDSWVVGDEPCVLVSFITARIELSQAAAPEVAR